MGEVTLSSEVKVISEEEEKRTRMIAKIRYYLKENDLTRPFFDPRLLIIPGLLFLSGVLPVGGGNVAIQFAIIFLLFELLVVYLVIIYKRINIILKNQKEILAQLNERKKS